mgnify:CR=1 FL=1
MGLLLIKQFQNNSHALQIPETFVYEFICPVWKIEKKSSGEISHNAFLKTQKNQCLQKLRRLPFGTSLPAPPALFEAERCVHSR